MKSYAFLLLLATLFVGQSFTTIPAEINQPPRWDKLGQRLVNYGLDRDEILVTALEGRFTAIRLQVKRAGINMHRCVVHFRNGDTQEIDIRENIPAGGATRIIDLQGPKRIIRKVVFWYDTKNIAARKGVVELWGRH